MASLDEEAPDARDLLGPMTQKTKVPDAQESDEIALCDGVTKLMKSEKYLYSFSGHSDVTYQETIPHHTFSAERHKPQWAKFEKQVAQITKERGFSALPEDIKKYAPKGSMSDAFEGFFAQLRVDYDRNFQVLFSCAPPSDMQVRPEDAFAWYGIPSAYSLSAVVLRCLHGEARVKAYPDSGKSIGCTGGGVLSGRSTSRLDRLLMNSQADPPTVHYLLHYLEQIFGSDLSSKHKEQQKTVEKFQHFLSSTAKKDSFFLTKQGKCVDKSGHLDPSKVTEAIINWSHMFRELAEKLIIGNFRRYGPHVLAHLYVEHLPVLSHFLNDELDRRSKEERGKDTSAPQSYAWTDRTPFIKDLHDILVDSQVKLLYGTKVEIWCNEHDARSSQAVAPVSGVAKGKKRSTPPGPKPWAKVTLGSLGSFAFKHQPVYEQSRCFQCAQLGCRPGSSHCRAPGSFEERLALFKAANIPVWDDARHGSGRNPKPAKRSKRV